MRVKRTDKQFYKILKCFKQYLEIKKMNILIVYFKRKNSKLSFILMDF